jgi:hypothetical protein
MIELVSNRSAPKVQICNIHRKPFDSPIKSLALRFQVPNTDFEILQIAVALRTFCVACQFFFEASCDRTKFGERRGKGIFFEKERENRGSERG